MRFRTVMAFLGIVTALCRCEAQDRVPSKLAVEARLILQTACHRCHGQDGAIEGGFGYVLDRQQLVVRKQIEPGSSEKSRIIRRIRSNEMPPEGESPRLSSEQLDVLERWINEEAPDFNPPREPRAFVSTSEMIALMHNDLRQQDKSDRRFMRYFTVTHLYNAGRSEDELRSYHYGVTKLINSLSWGRRVAAPVAIDDAKTILRIDLRDYKWTAAIWEKLAEADPYGITQPDNLKAKELYADTESILPHVRGDWFVATASKPPLYHEILQLPNTEHELEGLLHVDVADNIRTAQAARAGFNGSAVSRSNRLIERHESSFGYYWKSYDFAKSVDRKNLFAHPLGPGAARHEFDHDGGELIFSLPNGFQAYMLVNGKGRRIDKGLTEIVSDPKRPDRAVENGLSCFSCHVRGIIPKDDQVRAHVQANQNGFEKKEHESILGLYPTRERFQKLIDQDVAQFRRANDQAGLSLSNSEPIVVLAMLFEADLDLPLAVAEANLNPDDFQKQLKASPALARTLGALQTPGGTVKRELFARLYPTLAKTWKLGSPLRNTSAENEIEAADGVTHPERPSPPPESPPALTGPIAGDLPIPKELRVEINLPEEFSQVRTGGSGRYLIFLLPKAQKLAILDVAARDIVQQIPVSDQGVRFAAGRDHLMIVNTAERRLERWSLKTFQREQVKPIPGDAPVLACLMGCNSEGPLYVWSGGALALWDVLTLQPIEVDGKVLGGDNRWGFRLRVSADGRTVTAWHNDISPTEFGVMRLDGKKTVTNSFGGGSHNGRYAMPSGDGFLMFTVVDQFALFTRDLKPLAKQWPGYTATLPCVDPRFFLVVEDGKRPAVLICTTCDQQTVYRYEGVESMMQSYMKGDWCMTNGEPRISFVPLLNSLVSIASNKQIVVRHLDLLKAIEPDEAKYLFVVSMPKTSVAPNKLYQYQIDVRSQKRGLTYKLESAPTDMTVSAEGLIQWKVPAKAAGTAFDVMVLIADASGKELFHSFRIAVSD